MPPTLTIIFYAILHLAIGGAFALAAVDDSLPIGARVAAGGCAMIIVVAGGFVVRSLTINRKDF